MSVNLNKYDFIDYFELAVKNYYEEWGETRIKWVTAENIIKYFDDYTDEFNELCEEDRDYIVDTLQYNIDHWDDCDDPEYEYEHEYLI
jgi:hypothetical protein